MNSILGIINITIKAIFVINSFYTVGTNIILFVIFIITLLLMSYRRNVKKKIVFAGDSITEQGILLTGYISLINRMIEAEDLVNKYQTIGAGISGNRVYDLLFRIDKDVISKSPDITVVFIGINDIWCKLKNGTGLDIERYEKFYREVIIKLLAANSKIILCTPTVIGEKSRNQNEQDSDLNLYATVVRKLAQEYNLLVCDLRENFVNYLQENNGEDMAIGVLTLDGVHLNENGNKLVASSLWNCIKQLK